MNEFLVSLEYVLWRIRFFFFEIFGKRHIERIDPGHGDWQETCGWKFMNRFNHCDKSSNNGKKKE